MYDTEVDCSGVHMNDNEYIEHIRTLNKKQYELCIHVMYQLEEEAEPMHIFLEGEGGVGKNMFGSCINGNINKVL